MKGAREVKGDGAKQSQQMGGPRASETGPLFPRLHVNETEKAGPRPPPRNKMALYELFTIPSHRFVPSLGVNRPAFAPYSQQYVPSEHRHPYVSYYMPPTLSHGNANVGARTHALPSFGASCGSAVVDEDELQRVPGSQLAEKPGPCSVASKAMATARTSSHSRNVSEKKTELNDFRVPTMSAHGVQSKVSSKLICRISAGNSHKLCSSSTSGVKSVVGAHMLSTCDSQQEFSTTGLDCSLSENQSCAEVKNAEVKEKALFSVTDEEQPGQDVQPSAAKVSEQLSEDESTISPGCSYKKSAFSDLGQLPKSDSVSQGGPSIVHNKADAGKSIQHTGAGECTSSARDDVDKVDGMSYDSGSLPSKASVSLIEGQDNSVSPREGQETSHVCRDDLHFIEGRRGRRALSPTLEDNAGTEGGDLSTENLHLSARDKCDSSGESENFSNIDGAVSEPAHDCGGNENGYDESDSSMLDTVSAPAIAPKDVMRTVGQQQFWRARRAILRQQRIFSDQVFELHKLIKVQQLLAETPSTLIGEEICFGATPVNAECNTAACQDDNTQQENLVDKEVQNPVSVLKEVATNQSVGAGVQPEPTPCYPGWSPVVNNHSNGHMGVGPYPSVPVAWGYPSVGMGHWMGPMSAQAGSFFYQPFAGGVPPGSAPGGAYGSAAIGPGASFGPPPTVSFGSSNYDQWPEFRSKLHSRHGPTVPSSLQWPSAMCNNFALYPTPAEFPGSWYAMQHNHMSDNQRLMGVGGEDTVSGSVASITNQPKALVHTTNMPCVPGMPFHWGMNRQKGKTGGKGSSRPESEAEEHSQSVDAGSNANALPSTASFSFRQKSYGVPQDEHCWAQSLDLAGAYRSADTDNCDDDATFVGDKEAGNTSARWWKRQKEAGTEPVSIETFDEEMGVAHSPSQSVNALNLFPLVPSLNPIDHGRKKPLGDTEECQGRVIKVVPRAAIGAPELAAGILLSIQQERRQ